MHLVGERDADTRTCSATVPAQYAPTSSSDTPMAMKAFSMRSLLPKCAASRCVGIFASALQGAAQHSAGQRRTIQLGRAKRGSTQPLLGLHQHGMICCCAATHTEVTHTSHTHSHSQMWYSHTHCIAVTHTDTHYCSSRYSMCSSRTHCTSSPAAASTAATTASSFLSFSLAAYALAPPCVFVCVCAVQQTHQQPSTSAVSSAAVCAVITHKGKAQGVLGLRPSPNSPTTLSG